MSADEKPIVCVDLDGVLNAFDGWRGADFFHPPRPGAREFLAALQARGYRVVVFTVRWAPHVQEWLARHGLAGFVSQVTDKKPPAHVYIDDRAICFQGDFSTTLEQIAGFKAHWETGAPRPDPLTASSSDRPNFAAGMEDGSRNGSQPAKES